MTGINLGDFTVGVTPQLDQAALKREMEQAERQVLRLRVDADAAALRPLDTSLKGIKDSLRELEQQSAKTSREQAAAARSLGAQYTAAAQQARAAAAQERAASQQRIQALREQAATTRLTARLAGQSERERQQAAQATIRALENEQRSMRNLWQAGKFSSKEIVEGQERIQREALEAARAVDKQSDAYRKLTQVAAAAQRTSDAAQNRVTPGGFAHGVRTGIGAAGLTGVGLPGAASMGIVADSYMRAKAAAVDYGGATNKAAVATGVMTAAGSALAVGVGALATGFVALGHTGLEQTKIMDRAMNTFTANGVKDIEGLQERIGGLKDSLGTIGQSYSDAEFTTATANIVKAGEDADSAMRLLAASTNLAAAESLDLNDASMLLLKNLNGYKMTTEQAGMLADQLAAAGDLAIGSTTDISVGMNSVASTAYQAGLSTEQLLGMLVELDNAGLSAADRGAEGLRSALSSLADITDEGRKALSAWGIETEDSSGKARRAGDILIDLAANASRLGITYNETTGELEGSGEALRAVASIMDTQAAAAVLNLGGKWRGYSDQVKDSTGKAQSDAETMTRGIESSMTRLNKAWEDAGGAFAKSFAGPMADFLNNTLTPTISKIGELMEVLGKANNQEIKQSLKITAADEGTTAILKFLLGSAYQLNEWRLESKAAEDAGGALLWNWITGQGQTAPATGQVGGAILNGGAAQQVGQKFTLETMKALGNTFTHDPKVTSDCAVIAHAILTSLGLQLQKSPIAKDLMDNALKAGWQRVQARSGNLQVGDLLTFQGAGYGARMYDPTTGRYLGVRSAQLMRQHPNAVGYHSGVFAGYDAQGRMQITENPGSTRTQTRTLTAGELNGVIALRAPNSPWGAQGVYTVSNNRPMGGGSAAGSSSGQSPRPATPSRTPEQRAQDLYDQLKEAEASRNAAYIALVNKKVKEFVAQGYGELWDATKTANKSSGRGSKPEQTPLEREQAAQAEEREMDRLQGYISNASDTRLREIVGSDVGPNLSLAQWQMAVRELERRESGGTSSRRDMTPAQRQAADRARTQLEANIRNKSDAQLAALVNGTVGKNGLTYETWELAVAEQERRSGGGTRRTEMTPAQRQAADREHTRLETNIRNKNDAQLAALVNGTVGQNGLTYETWELAVREQERRRTGKPSAQQTPLQRDQATAQAAVRTEALETAMRSASPARLQEIVAGGVTPEISLEHWQAARAELKRREQVADREEEKRADAAVDRQKRVADATGRAEQQMSGYTVQQAQARAEVEQGNLDRFLANQNEQLRVAGDNTAERLRILAAGADEELQIRTNLLTAQLIAGKRANEKTRQDALDAIPKDAPQALKDSLTAAIEGAFATENTRLYTVFGDGMTEALRGVNAKTEEAGTARTKALERETQAVRDTVEGYEDLARNAQRRIEAGEWDADAALEYARALRGLDEAAEEAGISQNELVVGAQAAATLLGNQAQGLSDSAATLLGAAAAEIETAGRLAQQGNLLDAVMGLESLVALLEEGPQTPGSQKAVSLLNDELERLLENLTEGERLGLENTLAAIREEPEEGAPVAALPGAEARAEDRARFGPETRELGRGEAGANEDRGNFEQYGLDREKVRWTEEKTEALQKMTAAELAQRRAELERIGDSRALLELQMIDTLETERATTQTELLASAKAELDGLNKVSIPTWKALADKLEKQAALGGENAEELRKQAKALREVGEAAKKLEDQFKTLEKVQKGLDIVGDLFSRMSGGEANPISAAMNWASGGISAYMQWMSGDWAGAISTSINMIGDLGQAILDLSPGFQKWKSDMLEVAQTQKTALGLSTGGFISPWQKQLEQDAANREKQANAGFWQRVSWKLFGGAPQVMKTESAKLLAELQTIFAELGSGIANVFSSSMESAFLEGDMTRWAENFDKTFDEMVGKLIIKTMVEAAIQQGAVANDLANLTKAIQEQRYDDIPGILTSIKANARLALQPIADMAPSLPGYGSGKTDEQGNPVGGDLFGAAPTLQAGISHFELQLPPVILQGMTDFAASVPEFRAGVQEWRVAAAELRAALHGGVTPPRMSGNGGLT
ncbi:phage tail tape measure protein [Deinococcus sp. SL84]|uniref:phage tail tape measure protein n=1 Tax=Deinococcus sp. SL84 TaxID=2994663 RepID=UPI00227517D4|nr:phage tail tape measure protein [Deinococcus sp. SL84]MCY1703629.1 phage tail tape measure protein [Deinococcus sp. SL84]